MEAMAKLVHGWGVGRRGTCGLTDVGAVVGATWPAEAKALRALMPDTVFLVPGYGAQGGSAADALAGLRPDGRGCVVNSSRAIIGAWEKAKDADWAAAARGALDAMNADLARAR
jgi:orotidine-5'-phosphate decarboxylase